MARKQRPPNEFEREVLDVVLVELRRAMRLKGQLEILIDPWLAGRGTYVFASAHSSGNAYEIASRTPKRRTHGTRRR